MRRRSSRSLIGRRLRVRRRLVEAAGGRAIALGVAEVDIVCHDLCRAALVALFVCPVADLEPAGHHSHTAFGEKAADKFRRIAPCDDIDKIRFLFRALGRKIAVDSERKGRDRHAAAGPAQLGVTGKTTHENDLVQHE